MFWKCLAAAVTIAATSLAACNGDDEGKATPVINTGDGGVYAPAVASTDFAGRIDNPYLPLVPGSRWVYESTDGEERIVVEVLDETRIVMGIEATVVRDTVYEDGEVVEDTYDWFAQDRDGNVWYLGEASQDFEDGTPVSTKGSWEAGIDGALPGVVMRVAPAVGDTYRQEYYEGEAEDMAEVIAVDATENVAYGRVTGLLVTREWNPLEPDAIENKYYAPGIGLVLEVKVRGGDERIELVSYEAGR